MIRGILIITLGLIIYLHQQDTPTTMLLLHPRTTTITKDMKDQEAVVNLRVEKTIGENHHDRRLGLGTTKLINLTLPIHPIIILNKSSNLVAEVEVPTERIVIKSSCLASNRINLRDQICKSAQPRAHHL